jgi:hypothetical protein
MLKTESRRLSLDHFTLNVFFLLLGPGKLKFMVQFLSGLQLTTDYSNTLKADVKLNDIYKNSLLPFKEHTFVHYKDEFFNAVLGNSYCLP